MVKVNRCEKCNCELSHANYDPIIKVESHNYIIRIYNWCKDCSLSIREANKSKINKVFYPVRSIGEPYSI